MAEFSSPFVSGRASPLPLADTNSRHQHQSQLLIVSSSSVLCWDTRIKATSAETVAAQLASFPTLIEAEVYAHDGGRSASLLSISGVSLLHEGSSCSLHDHNGAAKRDEGVEPRFDDNSSPNVQHSKTNYPANSRSRFSSQKSCHENRLIQSLCNEGYLDKAMDVLRHMPKSATTDAYLSLLKLCTKRKSLAHVKVICAHLVKHRPELTGFLGDFLVVSLARCGAVEDAQEIASKLLRRTVFSWTAIISAYVNRGDELEALKLYECMRKEGVRADAHTYASLLKACSHLHDLAWGKIIHTDARKDGLATENFVGNGLVTMYGKCGDIRDAESAFLDLAYRDVVSWTAMLSAYLEQGQSKKALQLFRQMQEEGITPNRLTCVIALQACVSFAELEEAVTPEEGAGKLVSLEIGQALHAYACRKDLTADAFVGTTLLSMYGNCGSINMAEHMFCMLPHKCVVSYNAMLAAYVDHCHGVKALLLFKHLIDKGLTPDKLTYVSAIQACSTIADKKVSMATDNPSRKHLALKGQGGKALSLHREMQKQRMIIDDVALMLSWTAMLSGFIEKGQGEEALDLYRLMENEGVLLDDVALKCVLQACCLAGSLDVCRTVHSGIVCSGYDVLESVAATLIHAYGNCGSMGDAQSVFDRLSEPDIVSWSACIAGHAGEGDSRACLGMFEKLTVAKLMPDELTFTSILVVCCHSGQVARGLEFFESMSTDFRVTPDLKHYGIMLDLLGRAGDFNCVVELLWGMQMPIDLTMCMCLLGACQTHGNVELARLAFSNAVILQPKDATPYIMMSNIYAKAGMQKFLAEIEASRHKACSKDGWEEDDLEEERICFVS
ncbi:hypothetical protein GOP47_0013971 [Adiantum capillus-veneris]|uniref:Pentatricopeptide repeat-containing protein n=1 Tax=Adiantum capillus-veneris TaxID=13818 RepID=A0A9D4UPT8_ADICA|nr:hypothetical protein GOP47_0013971 [Adiantum capillus-veneris]